MDYRVHGILQARILEWVACAFSSRSSCSRNWAGVSCIAGGFFTNRIISEALTWFNSVWIQYECNWILNSLWLVSLKRLKKKKTSLNTEIHRENTMWWQKQGLEWCSLKLRTARILCHQQKLRQARKYSTQDLSGSMPLPKPQLQIPCLQNWVLLF